MEKIIEYYRRVVVQIATPYGTGTGFCLKDRDLIVTNEHVVRGNREVLIDGEPFPKQLVRVVYTDPSYDIALLDLPETEVPHVELGRAEEVRQGQPVLAVGHPLGLEYSVTQGIVSNTMYRRKEADNIHYFQHDAALNPGNSGGPLINPSGQVIGLNTFIMRDGDNMGFSLPVNYLSEVLDELKDITTSGDEEALRCASCLNIIFSADSPGKYCPHCGAEVTWPSLFPEYQPTGVALTIEQVLEALGYELKLCRKGPHGWLIERGSSKIKIQYNAKGKMIYCDALLAYLPKKDIGPLYEFMLRENHKLQSLSFSVFQREIYLSLQIHDQFLKPETARYLLADLFQKADDYDDVLIREYGAIPRQDFKSNAS